MFVSTCVCSPVSYYVLFFTYLWTLPDMHLLYPGIEVDLSHDHTPSTNWLGARSCFHRSPYSTELAPPTNSMNEACRRYQIPHPPVDSVMSETNLGCSDTTEKQSFPNGFANTSASSPSRKKIPCQDTPTFSPFEAPPTPAGLEEVKYEVLLDATGQFDRAPYKEGGHKIGEGGFGEVFQCSLVLKSGPVHAAVKVFLNQVITCSLARTSVVCMCTE